MEAIRTYIEEEPSTLKPHENNECEAGSPPHFHMIRKGYLRDHSLIRYIFGFVIIQFSSGWTLPYLFSNWISNRQKTGLPKEVLNGQKHFLQTSIPNRVKVFLIESAEVRKVFSKGQILFHYFKNKYSNQDGNLQIIYIKPLMSELF